LAELGRADSVLAIGPATYLAKRLSIEADGGTLISSSTRDTTLGYFHTKDRPVPASVAGGSLAHELIAITHVQTRFQAMATRGLTPFVGRGRELDQIKQAAARAYSGRGQVVAVIGEPGVGKSRLLHEFMQALQPNSRLTLVAGALSHRAPTSFQAFSDLIKAYFRITTGDDAAARQGKAANAVAALGSDEILDLFACLSLIDEPVTDSAWVSLEPSLRRDRILATGKKLLLDAARKQSIIVVLEDLHWLDADTQEALNSFVDSIALLPVLIVVTYRPEYSHKWHGKSYYSQLYLEELPEDTRGELLIHLTGSDPTLADCLPLLQRQGNPLFLEELVRSLADEQILEGRRGDYRLVRPIGDDFRVPAAVQSVLSARIDRLPSRERLVLQAASVIGDHVSVHILRSLAGLPQKELEETLSELQAAEFLYEDKSSVDRILRFKHALTRSVAYESQLDDQRCSLHKTIVASIETIYSDRLMEHIEQLAHHAIRGEMGIVAVRYALQAGTKAFSRFANREAVGHYEDALNALKTLPDSREKQEYAVDICCDLRNSLYPLAEYSRIESHLHEAERIASVLGDQQRLGWVSAYLSSLYLTVGRSAVEARALAARAANIAKMCENSKLQVAAQYYLTWAGYISGDYEGTERICRRLLRSLQGARARERFGVVFPAIQSRAYYSRALAERGEFGEADFLARDAVRLAEEFDHPFSLAWSCLALGHVMSIKGELDEAGRVLERGLEQCLLWKIDVQTPIVMARLGYVRALSDRGAEGVALLEQALREYERTGMQHFLSISIVQLGEAYLIANRVDDAHSCADRALNIAMRRGERGFEAWALRLMGGVATAEGRNYDEAQSHYDVALAKASQLRMRPLIAHCHFGLCNLNDMVGKTDAAKWHSVAAYALYSDLNMRFWSKNLDNITIRNP
jgi:tetratricopeptide (TPR) repeat protein